MTVGHALWPDQLDGAELAALRPGVPETLERTPDVLVVGGGIVGCATAATCLRAGSSSVVLVERAALGAGASGGAAGLLMPESHAGIDPPEFVEFMRRSLEGWRELEATWPGGVGLQPTTWRGHPQARVNPLRAIARLAMRFPNVATGVDVTAVSIAGNRIVRVETNIGEIWPRQVVFATGLPPRIPGLTLDIPSSEVKGHMLCTAPTGVIPPDVLADALGDQDLARVIDSEGRILMGGSLDIGDDSREIRPEVIAELLGEVVQAWPTAAGVAVEYAWACFRPTHPDHLPVIDRVPGLSNAWLTSGHYKTGILLAPATGQALVDWMTSGLPPGGVEPFNVARLVRTHAG